jgi:hypothetical protein
MSVALAVATRAPSGKVQEDCFEAGSRIVQQKEHKPTSLLKSSSSLSLRLREPTRAIFGVETATGIKVHLMQLLTVGDGGTIDCVGIITTPPQAHH